MLPSWSLSATVNAPRPPLSAIGIFATWQLCQLRPVVSEIAKLT